MNSNVANHGKVALAIVSYSGVSIAIIFLNRVIFTDTFPYPIFVSWWQQFFGFILLTLFKLLKRSFPLKFSWVAPLELSHDVAMKLLPLSMTFVAMVGLANACLKYVQISTYHTARSLTLIFNLLLSKIVLGQVHSNRAWAACAVVIFGFTIGSLDPSTLSLGGMILGASSSFFQACYSTLIKKRLPLVKDNVTTLLYYNLMWSSVLFLPCVIIGGEKWVLLDLPITVDDPNFYSVWTSLLGSAVLGISLSFVTYLCIHVTSPVTFNIVGYAKACIQSLGGIVLFSEEVSIQSASSIMLTLLGSFFYSKVKMSEEAAMKAAQAVEEESRELKKFSEKDAEPSPIGRSDVSD